MWVCCRNGCGNHLPHPLLPQRPRQWSIAEYLHVHVYLYLVCFYEFSFYEYVHVYISMIIILITYYIVCENNITVVSLIMCPSNSAANFSFLNQQFLMLHHSLKMQFSIVAPDRWSSSTAT